MALSWVLPWTRRSWRWFFCSPTSRGSPTIRTWLASRSGRGLPMPWGSSLLDLLDHGERKHAEQDLGVDVEHLLELLGRQGGPAPLVEPLGEGREMALGQLQPGGGGVAAEGDQALGAVADRLVQVEARDRPRRALGELVAEGHDDRRPVVVSTSRLATMPITPGCQPLRPRTIARRSPRPPSARIISCASGTISRSISWRRLLTRSSSSAIAPGVPGRRSSASRRPAWPARAGRRR